MAVSLSAGVRAALSSLSSTVGSAQESQLRLATGKKVNSAVDSPVNFFTAAGLNDRAGQLSGLLDGIGNGIQTIQAASKGIDSITKMVTSLQSTIKQAQNEAAANRPTTGAVAITGQTTRDGALNKTAAVSTVSITAGNTVYSFGVTASNTVRDVVNEINKSGIATATVDEKGQMTVTGTGSDALTTTGIATAVGGGAGLDVSAQTATANSAVRSNLIKQFNDLRDQLDGIAKDSGYNGVNLLGGDKLSITFNEKTGASKNKLDIQGNTINAANLGIGTLVDSATAQTGGNFGVQNDSDLAKAADALTNVLSSLRSTASSFGSNLAVVQARQDFTKSMIQTLSDGADNLTAADTNQEGAKLLALQTRQQLSQTALSLSNQADQAVLRLF